MLIHITCLMLNMITKILRYTGLQWLFYNSYRLIEFCYWEHTYDDYRKKHELDKTFRFNGHGILFYGDGRICAGRNSYIGRYSSIHTRKGYDVKIGENCKISHNVKIYTSSLDVMKLYFKGIKEKKRGSVIIGDNVWIGSNAYIGPGVTIGKNAAIGANAVITSNVKENEIVSIKLDRIQGKGMATSSAQDDHDHGEEI